MGEKWTPQKARDWLADLGIDEDSWNAIMNEGFSTTGATGHELKTAITIARGKRARDIDIVYRLMRRRFPQRNIKKYK